MFCTGCGKQLKDGTDKCPYCEKVFRAPASKPQAGNAVPPPPGKGSAASSGAQKPPSGHSPSSAEEQNGGSAETSFTPLEVEAGIDIGRGFSYFFKDEKWLVKSIIMGLVLLVPILNFAAIGYFVELARRVSNGIDEPVPEFDLAEHWKSGLMYAISGIIFALICCVVQIILALFMNIGFLQYISGFLIMAFSIVVNVYLIGAWSIAIIEGNPWIIFQFPQCFEAIRNNIGNVVVVALLMIPLYVISMAGSILFCVGMILTVGLTFYMAAHFFGQLGRSLKTQTKI